MLVPPHTTKEHDSRHDTLRKCFAIIVLDHTPPHCQRRDRRIHDDVPSQQKFGVAREERHPGCKGRTHADTLDIMADGEYDFIVVGGGSAGSVVAAVSSTRTQTSR